MSARGQEFIGELSPIILNRESSEWLTELEAVVVADDKTYNMPLLYEFQQSALAGESAQLTAVIKTKSFVVIRIVFEGDKGCYLRYELDTFNEKDIKVSSQPVDSITIAEDENLGKVELTLSKAKMEPVVFSFRNIVERENTESQ